MLTDADKQNGDVCGVDKTDEGADHVADSIALGDDEAIESADGAERGVEVARLCDRVGADKGLGCWLAHEGESRGSRGKHTSPTMRILSG